MGVINLNLGIKMNNITEVSLEEQVVDLLVGDDQDSSLIYEIEVMRSFAVANELDSQKMLAVISPVFTKKVPTYLDGAFLRLEEYTLNPEPDTYVSVYINEDEAFLDISHCQFDELEIYLPYNLINELGKDYRPKYSDSGVYCQPVDPIKAVQLFKNQNHKDEIIELNVNNYLRDMESLFDCLNKYIKQGLTDAEIIAAFDAIANEPIDNKVEETLSAPKPRP